MLVFCREDDSELNAQFLHCWSINISLKQKQLA